MLINYTLKYLDGSVYFNALGATTAGVCGVLFAGKLMAALPLKRMFRLSYVLSGSAMLVLTFSSDGWPRPLLALLVALAYGGTQSASTALFYANESLFDVKAVAASFSVCGLFSRCACALAPRAAAAGAGPQARRGAVAWKAGRRVEAARRERRKPRGRANAKGKRKGLVYS